MTSWKVFTGFTPIARHAAVLFETVCQRENISFNKKSKVKKMSTLSLMYVYSLQWFSTLYLYRLVSSKLSSFLMLMPMQISQWLIVSVILPLIYELALLSVQCFGFLQSNDICLRLFIQVYSWFKSNCNNVLLDHHSELYWPALRTQTSRRCWRSDSATSATISLSTASLRLTFLKRVPQMHFPPFSS